MTLLQRLQSHKGGLIRLKSELYWYDDVTWDKNPGRICLILDAAAIDDVTCDAATATTADGDAVTARTAVAAALLLVDGKPQWIWMVEADVEVIDEPT